MANTQYLNLQQINADTLYLTANSRIAEFLLQQVANNCTQKIFYAPPIFSLDNYLKQLSKQYFVNELLLSTSESLLIWQKTIPEELECISESTSLAHKAWEICNAYAIADKQMQDSHYLEVEIFLKWKQKFVNYCRKNQLISLSEIYDRIINKPALFAQGFCKIHWVGFNEFSDQQIRMQESIGIKQEFNHLYPEQTTKAALHVSTSTDESWCDMARWLKMQSTNENFETAICAVPNLNMHGTEIQRVLHSHFPEHCAAKPVFHISMATKLVDLPLFTSIVDILQCKKDSNNISYLANMLTSSFFNKTTADLIESTQLQNKMRVTLDLGADKKTTIQFLEHSQNKYKCAQSWLEFYKPGAEQTFRPASEWLETLEQWQQQLQWPGQFCNNDAGTQLWERWLKLITEIKRLDHILYKISFNKFCSSVTSIIHKSSFQFYNKNTAPIQILSIVEAAGLPVQHLWLANCDANTWPLQANPNPFMPYDLQRKLALPHSSSDREYEFATKITDILRSQSEHITINYSQTCNEIDQQLSPLLKNITITTKQTNLANDVAWISPKAVLIPDTPIAPIVSMTEHKGGSSLLQSVATCPLQAQLRWRIGIKQTEPWRLGPDARVRGQLVHRCMELIWQQLKNQTALRELNEPERTHLIETAVASAFKNIVNPTANNTIWQKNEKKLITALIDRWLTVELDRPDFSIHSCEENEKITLSNLQLKLRVDRVDVVHGNKLLIIDYKTGKCSANELLKDKTPSTQLPLYLYDNSESITGISFAQIATDDCKFTGISNNDTGTKGINSCEKLKVNWKELCADWRSHLTDLSERFSASDSRLMPYDNNSCNRCEFATICQEQLND